jgi:quinol monooxygenase YgiN
MSISLVVAGVGAVVAAIGVGMLMARCMRAPRGDLIAWLIALLGLLISLGAQALGYLMGFSDVSFRAMEIGAQLIAPLALVMGLSELVARSVPGRFASRLFLPALGLVALVILGTDPLSGAAFSKSWPVPENHYQLIPTNLMAYGLGLVTVIVALVLGGIAASRRDEAARRVLVPVACVVVAVLVLAIPAEAPGLSHHAGVTIPLSSLFTVLCLLAAGLTWYGGVAADRVPLAALRGAGRPAPAGRGGPDRDAGYDDGDRYGRRDDDSWAGPGWPGPEQAGEQDAYGGLYRDEPAGARGGPLPADDTGYGWQDGANGYAGPPGGDFDSRELDPVYGPGEFETGGQDPYSPARAGYAAAPGSRAGDLAAPPAPAARPEASRADLFGQIAIYTLIEDRVGEFDQLTERVVAKVRASEPDTLVFIVHAVPSAPMQRILYEVYADRAAFDRHQSQPYVTQFEEDRRPYVLATNVIELGLQQAKVSPFPSIADLFGEPGYDTSGFERPDYTKEYGSSAGHNGSGRNGSGRNGSGHGGGKPGGSRR